MNRVTRYTPTDFGSEPGMVEDEQGEWVRFEDVPSWAMLMPEHVEASVLVVEPGDVIVLKADRELSIDHRRRLVEYIRTFLGEDTKVLVLDGSMGLGVLRASASEDARTSAAS